MASITRVEAYKRRGVKGQTEHVHSYVRTVHDFIDSLGGPEVAAKKGINVPILNYKADLADTGKMDADSMDFEIERNRKKAAEKPLESKTPLQGNDVRRAIHVVNDETPEERDAIDSYVGIYYSELNNWKRGRGKDIDWAGPGSGDYIRQMDTHLQNVFSRLPGTEADVEVWRGRRSDPGWGVGDELRDPAYASTSSDRKVAESFADSKSGKGSLMRVIVPKGSKLLDEKEHGDENAQAMSWEKALMLPADSRFTITGVTTENGRKVYTMSAATPKSPKSVSLADDAPAPPPPPKKGGTDRKLFKEADGDWDPEVVKKGTVETSDTDLDPALVYLSLITRVQAYRRRGMHGQTEHVGSYVRRVNDLIDSMGGPKVAAKKGISVQVLKGDALKADKGQISTKQFEQRLNAATDQVDTVANQAIDRKYAPIRTPKYPPKVTADGKTWVMGVNEQTKKPELQMTPEAYEAHRLEVKKIIADNMDKSTQLTHATPDPLPNESDHVKWDPERQQAHRQIVSDLLAQAKARGVKANHRALMSGGLGGAGKSTTLRNPKTGINSKEYIELNPDAMKEEIIKRGLAPEVEGLQPMETAGLIHQESSDLAKQLSAAAEAEGLDVMWDITMASPSSVRGRLESLKKNGYETTAVFVDIPVEESVKRALKRHKGGVEDYLARNTDLGGRFVDPDIIRKNETKSTQYWSKNREVFEGLAMPKKQLGGPRAPGAFKDWQVWDNSGTEPVLVKRKSDPVGTRRKWNFDGKYHVKLADGSWIVDPGQTELSAATRDTIHRLVVLTNRN